MKIVTGCPSKTSCVSNFLLVCVNLFARSILFFAHQSLSEYLLRSLHFTLLVFSFQWIRRFGVSLPVGYVALHGRWEWFEVDMRHTYRPLPQKTEDEWQQFYERNLLIEAFLP
jgi:hypothetical protein